MLSNTTWQKRRQERAILADRIDDYIASIRTPKLVDVGVTLIVVEADPSGEEWLPGKPKLRELDRVTRGGLLDTSPDVRAIVAPTRAPVTWYCSVDQFPVIVHADSEPLGQLVYGSEGAGKSTAAAMWLWFRWLENLGDRAEIGLTAPTKKRLQMVRRELFNLWPQSWRHHVKSLDLLVLPDATTIQMVSTHKGSAEEGEKVQGYTWVACAQDELQDQLHARNGIEARGRGADAGGYKQLGTATAKDDPTFREHRDRMLAAKICAQCAGATFVDDRCTACGATAKKSLWCRRTLLGRRSPFVWPAFWDAKAAIMSDREYRRRVEAEDLPSERATYHAWDHEKNLITVNELWEDVTAAELAPWGANLQALVGHDPGALFDVSLLLKAYRKSRTQRPFWVVIREVTTRQTTTEQHVGELLDVAGELGLNLRDRNGRLVPDGPRMIVRADPYGNNDAKPDRSCYTIFRNAGVLIHPAAYSAGGDPTKPGRVPKNEGIELVNTLFCNRLGERRLFVGKDERGGAIAPMLVNAIESSERDAAGKAETQRKDEQDVSHWPSALRYALWAIERPRLQVARQR